MIAGIFGGGIIWAICFIPFLVFPEPLSFAAALLVGPSVSGYFVARLGGTRAAFALTIMGSIAALALSVIYLPDTSWEYPHHLWAGAWALTTLLVLGNFIFSLFGGSIGIQFRGLKKLKETPSAKEIVEPERDKTLIGTAPVMPGFLQTKMADLEMQEWHLQNDLILIKEKKGLEEFSPELLWEKKKGLETQLVDVILEKERLIRKAVANR
jgi:hypothetical protein